MQMLPPTSCTYSEVLRQSVINCERVTYKILQELKCAMHECNIFYVVYFSTIILLLLH